MLYTLSQGATLSKNNFYTILKTKKLAIFLTLNRSIYNFRMTLVIYDLISYN